MAVSDRLDLLRVVELEIVLVEVIRDVDQVQRHQLVESVLPVFLGHALANISCSCLFTAVSTDVRDIAAEFVLRSLQVIGQ